MPSDTNPVRRALVALRRLQADRACSTDWTSVLIAAQRRRAKSAAMGDRDGVVRHHDEVQYLAALGPGGYAVLHGAERPDFLDMADDPGVPVLYDQDDDEDDPSISIEFDEDGNPWVWAPDYMEDAEVLHALRECVTLYENTEEDHL